MEKNIKKTKKVRGQERKEKFEQAYEEWKLGKENSLKQLADKYKLHFQDLSRYITQKFQINKKH